MKAGHAREGRQPMTFPRALARYTRGVVNRVTLRLAGHIAFADLEHVGRKSSTVRHTPVRAFRSGNTVIVGLNFGRQSDWYQNIKAAGTCRKRLGGEQLTPSARRRLSPQPGVSRICPGCSGSRSGTWFTQPNVSSCLSCRHRAPRSHGVRYSHRLASNSNAFRAGRTSSSAPIGARCRQALTGVPDGGSGVWSATAGHRRRLTVTSRWGRADAEGPPPRPSITVPVSL